MTTASLGSGSVRRATGRGALQLVRRTAARAEQNKGIAPGTGDGMVPGPGRALEPTLREDITQRFGYDFSRVRVHSNDEAAAAADALNARAFTLNAHIVFGAGAYAPSTPGGRALIAHELAHVLQQRAGLATGPQLAPAPRRRTTLPTLRTARKTRRFFADLNAALTAVLGIRTHLRLSDYDIKSPSQFVAYAAQTTALSRDHLLSKRQATSVCAATTPASVRAVCGTDAQCPTNIRRYQRNRTMCVGSTATNAFIAMFMQTRGLTTAGGGQSVVIEEATPNKMLLNIVHEGVHRLRGRVWAQRSKIGGGYTHSRTGQRLQEIGTTLDEGTTQIITDLVITKLQGIRGRSWFRGYSSSAYAADVARVKAILSTHGKNIAFLKRAYTATSSTTEVQDLQLWQ